MSSTHHLGALGWTIGWQRKEEELTVASKVYFRSHRFQVALFLPLLLVHLNLKSLDPLQHHLNQP